MRYVCSMPSSDEVSGFTILLSSIQNLAFKLVVIVGERIRVASQVVLLAIEQYSWLLLVRLRF
jgi:hypothetical protein